MLSGCSQLSLPLRPIQSPLCAPAVTTPFILASLPFPSSQLTTTLASANAGSSPSHSWDRTPIGLGSLGWTGRALGPTAAPPVKGLVPSGSLGDSTEDLSLTRGFDVCLPVASLCQARIYFRAPCFW